MACLSYKLPLLGLAMASCLSINAVVAQEVPGSPAIEPQISDQKADQKVEDTADLESVASTAVPDDAELQAKGARIGRIDIKVVDVFDPENPKESGAVFRAANYLHINTREKTVLTQLLFKPGEPYSRHVLDETARNLRARRYLEDASIVPVSYHPDTNTVDLLVRVHDVWTLNPGVSFGRSGGENRSGFQLDESNLLGMGKAVAVDRVQDVDRSAWKFGYRDPNLFSTRWELAARYHDASDGDLQGLVIEHPFYSLDTRWSAAVDGSNETRMDRRYEQGVAVDQYISQHKSANIQAGWSTGLRRRPDHVAWVQRWTLGYRIDEQEYRADPVLGTTVLPEGRQLHYPWLALTWFQDQYEVTRNRDQIARTEDLYIGRSLAMRVGYAAQSWGSDRNALLVNIALQDAYRLSERQRLFAKVSIDGRRESGAWLGTVFSGSLRYDWRQGSKSLFVLSLAHVQGERLDASQQLFLGSDEGLRGYPLRYRSGTQRSVLVAEQRYFTDKQILRLLSVGGAAFVDAGRIGGEVNPIPGSKSIFTDVGLGLRLGNIRSSRGDMFHLDLAYPLDAVGADRKVQFSVSTKNSF